MKPDETIRVQSRVVACDGGGGALGHPLVYLRIGGDGEVVCPYCSRRFVLADDAQPAAAH
ncbi:MAG: zinc-finger domain-containing protein [Rhodospirillales bacterium]